MARQWIGKMFQQNQATEMDGNVGYVFRFDVFSMAMFLSGLRGTFFFYGKVFST
jgi:hypothetical protein